MPISMERVLDEVRGWGQKQDRFPLRFGPVEISEKVTGRPSRRYRTS